MSVDCYQLWQEGPRNTDDIYPTRVEVGLLGNPCPFGVTAYYDKSVSFNKLQSELEEQYGKGTSEHWIKTPLMSWRAEPEKVSILLEVVDKRMAKAQKVELGTIIIHYTDSEVPTRCGRQ